MKKQILVTIFLIIFAVVLSKAQASPEKAVLDARDSFSSIGNRSMELERVKREANKRPVDNEVTPNFPVIKEDFEQIQIINSKFLQSANKKTPINYHTILKFISEINHRAIRLKSKLFAAETKKKRELKMKQSNERSDIKILLDSLDKSINSFVHSPLFQNSNLVSSDDSLKAQKDLETVIKISFDIKAKAKQLSEN